MAILEKAKLLDVAAFLDAAGPVFHLAPRFNRWLWIKLLARLTTSKEQVPRIAKVLIAGLSHSAPQVQEAALQQLRRFAIGPATSSPRACPPRSTRWLRPFRTRLQTAAGCPRAGRMFRTPARPQTLLDEARKIPSPWRQAAGIDALLQAIDGNGTLSAVSFDPMAVPRLHPEDRVQPIKSLEELIERLPWPWKGWTTLSSLSCSIDGLSRLCDQQPDDFQARVAPLLARIEKLLPTMGGSIASAGLRVSLFVLILRWGGRELNIGRQEGNTSPRFPRGPPGTVVGPGARSQQPGPLLACPTHRQGWIDPAEMAARLRAYHERGLEPAKHDFIQGVLRLTPMAAARMCSQVRATFGTNMLPPCVTPWAAPWKILRPRGGAPGSLPAAISLAPGRADRIELHQGYRWARWPSPREAIPGK